MDGLNIKTIKINSLKYGQDKNLSVEYKFNPGMAPSQSEFKAGTIDLEIGDVTIHKEFNNDIKDMTYLNNQECRFKAIECINNCISQMKFNEKNSVKGFIISFLEDAKKYDSTQYIENIIFDFEGQNQRST